MTSSAQRGAYYKARTRKFLEAQGYQVADLERVHWIFRQGQRALATKHDQFGADLLAVSPRSVIFVQVKGGASVCGGNFPDARRKFSQYRFPPWTRQWVIAWPARSRAPRIVEIKVTNGEAHRETTLTEAVGVNAPAYRLLAGDGGSRDQSPG